MGEQRVEQVRGSWRCAPVVTAGLGDLLHLDAHSVVNRLELSRENSAGDAIMITLACVNALIASLVLIVGIDLLGGGAKGAEHLAIVVLIQFVRPNVVGADAVVECRCGCGRG